MDKYANYDPPSSQLSLLVYLNIKEFRILNIKSIKIKCLCKNP